MIGPRFGQLCRISLGAALLAAPRVFAGEAADLFSEATRDYQAAYYDRASEGFTKSAALLPASGTLLNLGLAEWQQGRVGTAVCAWEQASWINPYSDAARSNLRFARKNAQLEAPDLTWFEVVSTWLPADWWAWITGASLWLAIAMVTLPGILRRPRRTWQQASAALGLMVFLLCVPAHAGVRSRARIGFVLHRDTPLRLTPTHDSQFVTRLPAGYPARLEGARGQFVLVRAGSEGTRGWLDRAEIFLISDSVNPGK